MKLKITGASNFVNRMFEACGSYQWAREFLKNSIEASATRVEFGIEWQAVEKKGFYRRTIIDNGLGMNRDELARFFSTLGEGAKEIGTVHQNFGVGAKIASLPWNSNGVVVISYKDGVGSMIWMVLDDSSSDYELVEFSNGNGKTSVVVEPGEVDGINWAKIRPEWLKKNGTIVVLLGSDEHPDTVLGNTEAGEKDIKGLSVYLNSRFWDLDSVDVKVLELRSEKRSNWPRSYHETDDSRRHNGRQIHGAEFYLTKVKAPAGKLVAQDTMILAGGRVKAEWYLWGGERPAIHSYAKKGGYIAIKYNEELYELSTNKVDFRAFGVVESKVQQNLTIILEPQHYGAKIGAEFQRWGVHPDQSRNRMIFSNSHKGVAVPIWEWGTEFADHIPAAILEAIQAARGELAGTIESEEYRKRLQDKFGQRWAIKRFVQSRPNELHSPATERPGVVEATVPKVGLEEDSGGEVVERVVRKDKVAKQIHRDRADENGKTEGSLGNAPVDVPRYRFARADSFERPWHIALWAPHDAEGPMVLINVESHVLTEIIRYHQEQYPDVYAEEVAETVRRVFGEIAACKIAHSQKLNRLIPEEELDRDYRSEAALTVGLMGLLAEEAVIAQRLSKYLGKMKPHLQVVS